MRNTVGIHAKPGIFQDEVISKMRKYFLFCWFHYLFIHLLKVVSIVVAIQQKLRVVAFQWVQSC